MAQNESEVSVELFRLGEVTIFELRRDWLQLYQTPPPMRLSRDLLIRGIAYKLQERALGGLSKSVLRKLEQFNSQPAGTGKPARQMALKPGTRLVREWRGVTHTVLVHADSVEWRGQRYRSLSIVAHRITGAHWSGPRFFGLKPEKQVADG